MRKYMIQNNKYYQDGSTIVEAIVAIFVMSFGVLALMLAQLSAANTSVNAANQAEVTRAVQNYVERMQANAIISIQETLDAKRHRILFLKKDYTNFVNSSCASALNITLTNSSVVSCTITADGKVTVKWKGQSPNSTNNEFSYTIKAGQ